MASRNPMRRMLAHFARQEGGGTGYRRAARFLYQQGILERPTDSHLRDLYGRGRAGRNQRSPRAQAERARIEAAIAERVADNPRYIRDAREQYASYAPRSHKGLADRFGIIARDSITVGIWPTAGESVEMDLARTYSGARPLLQLDIHALLTRARRKWGAEGPFGLSFFGDYLDAEKPVGQGPRKKRRSPTAAVADLRALAAGLDPQDESLRGASVVTERDIFSAPGGGIPGDVLGVPPDVTRLPESHYARAYRRMVEAVMRGEPEVEAARDMAAYFAELCTGFAWTRLYGAKMWRARE